MNDSARQHRVNIEIGATPEQVWEALSTAEGIASWFAPVTRVEPGAGGQVYMKWGPGVEGSQRIEIWEPGRHLRVANDRAEGAPPSVVDYFLEAQGGATVLRLVHSGFGPDASFDAEHESTGSAWPVFLKMMKHSVERGTSTCRNMTVFRILSCSRDECWAKLTGPHGFGTEGSIAGRRTGDPFALRDASGEVLQGVVRHNGNGVCCLEFPDRQSALLSVFCENAGEAAMLTVTWLLYGTDQSVAEGVRDQWSGLVDRLFAQNAAA
jgi:uncharacterized protein YndB with AHSA1/START domain